MFGRRFAYTSEKTLVCLAYNVPFSESAVIPTWFDSLVYILVHKRVLLKWGAAARLIYC